MKILKIQDGGPHHIENCVLSVTQQLIVRFGEILRGEAVFVRILAMGQILTFHSTYFLFS